MKIYYMLIEGEPKIDNEESLEFEGAYINCWVMAKDKAHAKEETIEYINSEGWNVLKIEKIKIVKREWYLDELESLECFDQAINDGIGAIFYTWPKEEGLQ